MGLFRGGFSTRGKSSSSSVATLTTEPSFRGGTDTLIFSDDFDRYSSINDMGSLAYGSLLRIAPLPSAAAGGGGVNTSKNSLITGRLGSGNAIRSSYNGDGITQDSVNWVSIPDVGAFPGTTGTSIYYASMWKRVIFSGTWPQALTMAVKWYEQWHVTTDRIQWNTHDHLPSAFAQPSPSWDTYWQIIDFLSTTNQGGQPIPPRFNTDIANTGWHRFTYAYRCNTSGTQGGTTSRDGFAMMWVDGVLTCAIHPSLRGVTPTGTLGLGFKPWCDTEDCDMIAVNDPIRMIQMESTETGDVVPAFTIDTDDYSLWTGPVWY